MFNLEELKTLLSIVSTATISVQGKDSILGLADIVNKLEQAIKDATPAEEAPTEPVA